MLDEAVTRIMVSMLEGVVSAGTGTAVRRSLPPDVAAAGKTGTTNESSNVWFAGFTPSLVALVWFGMDRPIQIRENATGGADAAPVWGEFMRDVYIGTTDEDFGLERRAHASDTGPVDNGRWTHDCTSRQPDRQARRRSGVRKKTRTPSSTYLEPSPPSSAIARATIS